VWGPWRSDHADFKGHSQINRRRSQLDS